MIIRAVQNKRKHSVKAVEEMGQGWLYELGLYGWKVKVTSRPYDFDFDESPKIRALLNTEPLAAVTFDNYTLSLSHGNRQYRMVAIEASVLHEIGHIVYDHGFTYLFDPHRCEFDADEFAFTQLFLKHGHVPIQATTYLLSGLDHWNWQISAGTHPAGITRWRKLQDMGFIPEYEQVAVKWGLTDIPATRGVTE